MEDDASDPQQMPDEKHTVGEAKPNEDDETTGRHNDAVDAEGRHNDAVDAEGRHNDAVDAEGGHDDAADVAGPCDACPESTDGPDVTPSIYRPFWRDARAELERRDYAKILATVGGITAIGSLAAPVAGLTQVFDRKYEGPVYADGIPLVDDAGERITEDRLAAGEQLTVFPEARPGVEDAPTLLVRFDESAYSDEVRDEYTVGGYAAFSKVCTHAGCMVADRDGDILICPCHSGRFDPITGAQVVGGPPPRSLPQLPITISGDGYLVATGDFQGAVGPGGE